MNTYVENINDIIHETSVDFVLRPCAREIHIVQYDKSLPIIKVELFREGERYALPSAAAVHVRLGKLDNTFVYANILGTNEERNIIYFAITEQMAMIPGRVSPVIEVVYQGKVACSSPIHFVIDRNPVQEGQIESHDEFPVIYDLESDVAEHDEWIRQYTALTMFDGFVEGESVWDDIAEGETKYCQSGSQTEDIPGENTVIKIDLSQQHLIKSESKALYIKKIIINYTPDGQEEEEIYEYTFNSRIFGNGSTSPTIEPLYADLTDNNSGTTLRWYLNYLLAEGVSNYFGSYNGTKGQQFGSNSNPPSLISLSTSSLENCTVNSIYVEVSSNSGTQAKCKLTIVNDVWTCNNIPDPQITSSNEEYEWLHEPNGTHLGSSSGGQVIHHYNHVFLKKENGRVTEVQPDPALQYVLNDYTGTYKFDSSDNLLHKVGGGASFELLNKIEFTYDSEDDITYITFPKNILPSVYYEDYEARYLYFDYKNRRIIDSLGTDILYNDEMSIIDGKLSIQLSGQWELDPNYDYMQYDLYDGFDNPIRHSILMPNNYELHHLEDIYATIDYVDEEIAYALSSVYKPKGSSTVSNLNNISKSAGMSGDIYNMSDGGSLTNQDSSTVAVLSGDNVVFCWNNGSWYWDKMAATVDLSNYLQKSSSDMQSISSHLQFQGSCGFVGSAYFSGTVSFSSSVSFTSSTGFYGGITSSLYPNSNNLLNLGMAGGTGGNQYYWNDLYLKGKIYLGTGAAQTIYGDEYNRTVVNLSATFATSAITPSQGNNQTDLGSSTAGWKDGYFSGTINIGTSLIINNLTINYDNSGTPHFINTTTSLFTFDQTLEAPVIRPTASGQKDLGISSRQWRDLYLSRNLTDGTNSVTVANIASKIDTTEVVDLGTFDSNGNITIAIDDLEHALFELGYEQELHGMYMLTYTYAQAVIYLDKTQISTAASQGISIRAPMPVVHNSSYEAEPGNLVVSKNGTNYIFRVANTNRHALQGVHMYLIPTKLIK